MRIAWASEEAARKKATADQARKILSEIVETLHGEVISNESCREYFTRWQDRRSREVSEATKDRYGDVFKSLAESLGKNFDAPLSELSQTQLAGWRDGLSQRYSPVSVNICLKIAKQALKDAWRDGLISESPAEKLVLLKLPRGGSARKVFTLDQFQRILAAAEGEWEGMILAGAFTGQRLADIAWMEVAAVEGGWWRFKTRKTGLAMAVPLAKPLEDWIAGWLRNRKVASRYVFPEAQGKVSSGKGRSGKLSNQFHRIMARAGIVAPRNNNVSLGVGRSGRRAVSELSFHSFRHTCTTWLKAQGVSESVAMAFVGHESEAVNRNYTHLPETTLLDAMRQMEKFSVVRAA